jgi:hypothetical protein
MDIETESVAESMRKPTIKFLRSKNIPGRTIERVVADAGTNEFFRCTLGTLQYGKRANLKREFLPGKKHATEVAAVPMNLHADIQLHEVSWPKTSCSRLMVWPRGVRTERHDGIERHAIRPQLLCPTTQFECKTLFSNPTLET